VVVIVSWDEVSRTFSTEPEIRSAYIILVTSHIRNLLINTRITLNGGHCLLRWDTTKFGSLLPPFCVNMLSTFVHLIILRAFLKETGQGHGSDSSGSEYGNDSFRFHKTNSVAWVRERTMLTEHSLYGEISANFLRIEGVMGSAWWIPTAVFSAF
jgi:hypothetical protein